MTFFRNDWFIFGGLLFLLFLSAMGVINSKYQSRLLFVQIQQLERQLDEFEVEWGRLQLELTTLAEEHRIESVARKGLKLSMPERDKIVYLKPH